MAESLPGLFLAARSSAVLPEVGMPVLSNAPWKLSYPTKPVQKEKASRLQHCRAALAARPHLPSPVPVWESGSGHPIGEWHSCSALSPSQSPTCTPGGWDTAWGSSHPVGWGCPADPAALGCCNTRHAWRGPQPRAGAAITFLLCGGPSRDGSQRRTWHSEECSHIKQPDFPVYSGSVTAGRT